MVFILVFTFSILLGMSFYNVNPPLIGLGIRCQSQGAGSTASAEKGEKCIAAL